MKDTKLVQRVGEAIPGSLTEDTAGTIGSGSGPVLATPTITVTPVGIIVISAVGATEPEQR